MSSPARSSERDRARILYLITTDISARFLRGQLGHLVEHGFEVHVATATSDPPADFDDGVVVHRIGYEREPDPIADAKGLWATISLIRRVRPRIVNASTPKAGLLGMLAARVSRVPQRVYVVRGLRFETMSGARRHVFRWLERLATACATDVVYNSRSLLRTAERERAVAEGRGVVLAAGSGNGIDPAPFRDLPDRIVTRRQLGIATDGPVVGFVGRLTRDKGIVDLVRAFESEPDLTVVLVGDPEPGDQVPPSTLERIESAPHFVRLPWIDDPARLYRALDVVVFPSYREGLPNVPLEAQLCGVPVVAYASTGTVDAIAPALSDWLVAPADHVALRERTRWLLDHPDAAAEAARSASAWVRNEFSQQRIWSELVELYG